MSEDEIITKAKDIAKRGIDPNEYIEDLIMRETIQGLLDLYNKEKEKNEKLVDKTIQYDKTLEKLQKDTIWKDKLKAKIEELEDLNSKFSQRIIKAKEVYLTELVQNILKELLEEE